MQHNYFTQSINSSQFPNGYSQGGLRDEPLALPSTRKLSSSVTKWSGDWKAPAMSHTRLNKYT